MYTLAIFFVSKVFYTLHGTCSCVAIYSITLSSSFCFVFITLSSIIIITIVFVSPYKQPYERYNKLDIAMVLPLGVILFLLLLLLISSMSQLLLVTHCLSYFPSLLWCILPSSSALQLKGSVWLASSITIERFSPHSPTS